MHNLLRLALFGLIVAIMPTTVSFAAVAGIELPDTPELYDDNDDTVVSIEELLAVETTDTKCATAIMKNALTKNQSKISAASTEQEIKSYITAELMSADVLRAVLACPEIAGTDEMETIKFLPIEYTAPGGQHLVINYEAQPKLLKQRLMLATKHSLTSDDSGGIGGDGAVWVNTDPSWYAIMVTQAGALDNFVGDEKNNIIPLRYIYDHIDEMYPSGWSCTSKSALANDSDEINLAMKQTIGLGDEDTNDYYVAGDVNLSWISYTEIALDIALTVATFGASATASIALKSARAVKTLRNLERTIKNLRQLERVQNYMRLEHELATTKRALETAKTVGKASNISKLEKEVAATKEALEVARNANKADDVLKLEKELETAEKALDFAKNHNHAADIIAHEKRIKDLNKGMKQMEKADDNVKQYKQASESFSEINKWRRNLKGIKRRNHGNVLARSYRTSKAAIKSIKASRTGAATIKKGSKIARSSMKSGKLRDWLFHATRATGAAAAKGTADASFLYGAIKFAGDMYDYTATSTDEFTSGLDFKPLLLLSADDIEGQDNVVNYGMWLMWSGDSDDMADDDAAYLQAMDFAEKFWVDLTELQENTARHTCNIDIYVVHPVIRNPGTPDAELYYLIMTDIPWTTANE